MKFTHDYIKSIIDYNHKTGSISWKVRPQEHFKTKKAVAVWNGKYSGKTAGCNHTNQNGKQYRLISIDSKRYVEHRVIWFLVTGKLPVNDIDHIDGNGLNNKIKNLRDVTRAENNKNFKLGKRNKSGFIGVHFDKSKGRYKAEIGVNSKTKFIGYFDTAKEANEARKKESAKYGYHKNHGS